VLRRRDPGEKPLRPDVAQLAIAREDEGHGGVKGGEWLQVFRRVELCLPQAEDLAARARPVALRADGEKRPALLLDGDPEGESPVLRALADPGGHGRSAL